MCLRKTVIFIFVEITYCRKYFPPPLTHSIGTAPNVGMWGGPKILSWGGTSSYGGTQIFQGGKKPPRTPCPSSFHVDIIKVWPLILLVNHSQLLWFTILIFCVFHYILFIFLVFTAVLPLKIWHGIFILLFFLVR